MYKRQTISEEEIRRQRAICGEIFERINASRAHPLAMVDTYGCQQNEADSEIIPWIEFYNAGVSTDCTSSGITGTGAAISPEGWL